MKPARMRSRWVKLLPWVYHPRRQPTRAQDHNDALTDWRHLPVTHENYVRVHEEVRCVCGHPPTRHYDMTSFCLDCLDGDGCEEFRDA